MAAGAVDYRAEALVPPGTATAGPGRFRPARAQELSPDHVRVHLPAGAGGWLVLANAYSPAWKAESGGRSLALEPTNSVAMGVAVPHGARTVDFRLDRTVFYLGALISVLSLAATGALALTGRRRRRRAPRPVRGAEARAAHSGGV
jgi:hypothetical protein